MGTENFQGKNYKIYPLYEAIFIGISVFLAIFITTYFIYQHAINAQKGEIKEGLIRTAQVVAVFIDGDEHKKFISSEQEKSDSYLHSIQPFEAVLNADKSIKYLYTTILKDDKVYFILDPTPSGDADGDGVDDKAHIMDEYTEASSEIKQALRNQEIVVSEQPYSDRWGSFVSGYIPFYDKSGNFSGVLGIDIEAKNYFERLAPIKRATTRTMVAGFFIAFLIASLVWFTRNFGLVVNQKRLDAYERIIAKQSAQIKESHLDGD